MRHSRIGEWLKRNRRITDHDVEEILHEQDSSPRLFGEIAMSWGLCQPQDVWSAWFNQLAETSTVVDIDLLGVDSLAIEFVPRSVALTWNFLPLRLFADGLVAASAVTTTPPRVEALRNLLGKEVRFVRARAAQIQAAMQRHYGDDGLPA
jgi:hypothetical protein